MIQSTTNGKKSWVQEWRENPFLRYNIKPPDLLEHCNGFGLSFGIFHALACKKGCLNTTHHNDLCDGSADLASKAFTSTCVRDDPKIYTVSNVRGGKNTINGSPSKYEGDL